MSENISKAKPVDGGNNGVTKPTAPATTSSNNIKEAMLKSNNPISPSTSTAVSTTPQGPPKGIMNTSGTSGAIVSNTPSGIRKVPTVTFSDPKKVIVTPLQQHIQQHKEQQRELKEQKEHQKNEMKGQKIAHLSEDNGNEAKSLHPTQKLSPEKVDSGYKLGEKSLQKDNYRNTPVSFQLASPTGSSGSLTSSNLNSIKEGNSHQEKTLLKDTFSSTYQTPSPLRKDSLNAETSTTHFQDSQRANSYEEHPPTLQSPLKTEVPFSMAKESVKKSFINFETPQKPPASVNSAVGSDNGLRPVKQDASALDNTQLPEAGESAKQNDLLNMYAKDTVKNIHPSLPLDDGRLHVLLGACGSLSVLKLKMLIKKLEDVYGGQKKVAIQVIVTETAERLLFKRHQERQLMKEQKELKQQKSTTEQQNQKDETPEIFVSANELLTPKPVTMPTSGSKHSLDLPPHIKVWKDSDEWDVWQSRTDPVLHIELRRWADILVVAPMTANTLSKIALGLCDNLLTNVIRAWNPSSPILLAPSMVSQSYNSVITKRHLKFIKEEMPWITVFKPAEKIMGIHGDIGLGGMMDPHEIVNKIVKELGISDEEEEEEEDEESEDEELNSAADEKGVSDKVDTQDKEKTFASGSNGNRVTLKKEITEDEDDSDDYDEDDEDEDEEDEEQMMDEEDELEEFEIEQEEHHRESQKQGEGEKQ